MKAMLIFNPAAGQRDVRDELDEVIAYLRACGWEIILRQTMGPGDATTYAREAAANRFDVALAVGGDGTLGQVASGLVGSECALGVLPVGTGNVWAHMMGLPVWTPVYRTALLDSARALVSGQVRRVDMGKAGDRYFILWSGIGFDAQVAREIEPLREIRRSFGNVTYLVTSIALSLGLRGTRMTVTIDGKAFRQRVLLIVVSNAQLYGSSWMLAPQAQLDDGLLDVYIFKGGNTLDIFRHLFMVLLGKHQQDPKMEIYRARSVTIRGERSFPLHTDGDPAGNTPVTITVAPKALNVIVPSSASGSLFEGGAPDAKAALSLAQRIAERLRYERERWLAENNS